MWYAELDVSGKCIALLSPAPAATGRFVLVDGPTYLGRTYNELTGAWSDA